ncbi:MAG: hypothetical protein Q7R81_04410 [Candidatus Peregrinibacteria bacterium]|nr:hypothetical protein [Candidatus Peregrinibacteria bacterium]
MNICPARFVLCSLGCLCALTFVGCSPAPVPTPIPQNSGQDISQEAAIEVVRNRPEVVKFESTLVKAGTVAHIDAQSEDKEWLVQVYEVKGGHTATFNWYRVDKKTGQISTEFP